MLGWSSSAKEGTFGSWLAPVATTTRSASRRLPAGRQDEAVILPGECVHLEAGSNRQIESSRVGLEIVGHLVLRGKRQSGCGEAPACQPVVSGRGEQAKRVPALAPGVADSFVGVQDYERTALLLQVVSDREACLAATDDHGLEVH